MTESEIITEVRSNFEGFCSENTHFEKFDILEPFKDNPKVIDYINSKAAHYGRQLKRWGHSYYFDAIPECEICIPYTIDFYKYFWKNGECYYSEAIISTGHNDSIFDPKSYSKVHFHRYPRMDDKELVDLKFRFYLICSGEYYDIE